MAPDHASRPDPDRQGSTDAARAEAASTAPQPAAARRPEGTGARAEAIGGLSRLRGLVDGLLVADVFLVLAGALWFALAVVLHSQGVEGPLELFQRLWQPLFTPAISLLMGAALLSGALGWWQRRGQR